MKDKVAEIFKNKQIDQKLENVKKITKTSKNKIVQKLQHLNHESSRKSKGKKEESYQGTVRKFLIAATCEFQNEKPNEFLSKMNFKIWTLRYIFKFQRLL